MNEKQRQIGPDLGENVLIRNVKELPQDIDGLSANQIDNVNNSTMVQALKDGGKWGKKWPIEMEEPCKSTLC